jgi:hypothetical protein
MKNSIVPYIAVIIFGGTALSLVGQTRQGDGTGAVTSTGTAGAAAPAAPAGPQTVGQSVYSRQNLETLFQRLDANRDGSVSREEFLSGTNAFAAVLGAPPPRVTGMGQAPGETTPTNPR